MIKESSENDLQNIPLQEQMESLLASPAQILKQNFTGISPDVTKINNNRHPKERVDTKANVTYSHNLLIAEVGEDKTHFKTKITQDIKFLADRIAKMNLTGSSNTIVLKTYEDMLTERQTILDWLNDGQRKLPVSL